MPKQIIWKASPPRATGVHIRLLICAQPDQIVSRMPVDQQVNPRPIGRIQLMLPNPLTQKAAPAARNRATMKYRVQVQKPALYFFYGPLMNVPAY